MSYAGPPNPYASPVAPPVAFQPAAMPWKPIDRIEYMRAYQYVFESPNWTMNLVWGFLCLISQVLIPVIGQLVLLGYRFEVIDGLLSTQGTRYPDFDANRFADYLGRSIWPFLVGLVLMIPVGIIVVVGVLFVFLLAGIGGALGGDDFGPAVATVATIAGLGLLAPVAVVVAGICLPIVLRAGLLQDFAGAFEFQWALDFLKKTWVELVLAYLFLMATGFGLMILGYLALCIGAFVAQALILFARTHLLYQLYLLYLSRGGAPVPARSASQMMGKPI